MQFEVTTTVEVDLTAPLTVQERARVEQVIGSEGLRDLEDPAAPITAGQTRAVVWAKLVTRFPDVKLDQFDSIAELAKEPDG